jgi:hypothetical protein
MVEYAAPPLGDLSTRFASAVDAEYAAARRLLPLVLRCGALNESFQ